MSEEELEDLKWQQTECEEDIIGELIKKVESLQNKLQQKENIIKEAREYIKSNEFIGRIRLSSENKQAINKLLQILDKENNDIEFDMLKALNTDLDDDVEMG